MKTDIYRVGRVSEKATHHSSGTKFTNGQLIAQIITHTHQLLYCIKQLYM